MPRKNSNPRTVTLFSINPKTGKPYMEYVDMDLKLTKWLWKNARSLLIHNDIQDLKQNVYVKLLGSEYNPDYEPNAILFMAAKATVADHYIEGNKKKNISVSDGGSYADGEEYRLSDNASDSITPEDIILANEVFNIFRMENLRNAVVWGDDLRLAPDGWKGPAIVLYKKNKLVENYRTLI